MTSQENPGPDALTLEKRKDYRNAVAIQLALLVAMLTMKDILELVGLGHVNNATWNVYLLLLALYFYLLWDMLRNFTSSPWLLRGTLALVLTLYALNLVLNGLLSQVEFPRFGINLTMFGCGLAVQLLVIAYALSDLFESPRNTVDKLWGSACIYFMSGFAFATVYHMVHTALPGAFGVPMEPDHLGLTEALYYSFNCLVGLDSAYPAPIHLVRNLAVLEGCWGQLYLVLLIGRVLMPAEGSGE